MRFYRKEPAWRNWFAWYPVGIDGAKVWLELVEKYDDGGYRVFLRNKGSTDSVEQAARKHNYLTIGD